MIEPRPELASVRTCAHGSVSDRELAAYGLSRADVIDFSASTNPHGPPPSIRDAILAIDPSRYPDDSSADLRDAISRSNGVPPDHVLAGNGSAELIWLLALAYLRPGDRALVVGPTFGEYARACAVMGVRADEIRSDAETDFAVPLAQVEEYVSTCRPRMIFICNPNNPTGSYLTADEIARVAVASRETLVVVDEAYRSFVREPWASESMVWTPLDTGKPAGSDQEQGGGYAGGSDDNVVLLRSLTKDYALAGLRLGYLLASPPICEALSRVRPPWSVNSFSQSAGIAALSDNDHLERTRSAIWVNKAELIRGLKSMGQKVTPGAANFILVDVGDAYAFRSDLLRVGCCVRDCTSFGLPRHVRIGVRTLTECRTLLRSVERVLTLRRRDDARPLPPVSPGVDRTNPSSDDAAAGRSE